MLLKGAARTWDYRGIFSGCRRPFSGIETAFVQGGIGLPVVAICKWDGRCLSAQWAIGAYPLWAVPTMSYDISAYAASPLRL